MDRREQQIWDIINTTYKFSLLSVTSNKCQAVVIVLSSSAVLTTAIYLLPPDYLHCKYWAVVRAWCNTGVCRWQWHLHHCSGGGHGQPALPDQQARPQGEAQPHPLVQGGGRQTHLQVGTNQHLQRKYTILCLDRFGINSNRFCCGPRSETHIKEQKSPLSDQAEKGSRIRP